MEGISNDVQCFGHARLALVNPKICVSFGTGVDATLVAQSVLLDEVQN